MDGFVFIELYGKHFKQKEQFSLTEVPKLILF